MIRGPIRPSRRAQPRDRDQLALALPIEQPSARRIEWQPGDPVHPAPVEVDPDPRPAVLTDPDDHQHPDEDAARWRPGLLAETSRRRGRPGPVVGRSLSGVAADHCSPPARPRRSLIDD